MNIKSLLLGSAAALAVVSGAQAADAIVAAAPEPAEYVKVCDAFGAGYFYIPGSETCLKIGGRVRYDIKGGDYLGLDVDGLGDYVNRGDTWSKKSRAELTVQTAQDTEYGALKTTFTIRSDNNNNNFSGVNTFLEEATISIGGLTVGQTDSLFTTMTGYAGNVINDGDLVAYGPFESQLIKYTYDAGNGFSIAGSLEHDDVAGDDYVPNAVIGAAYTNGTFGVSGVVGYDEAASEAAIKARVDGNFGGVSAFLMAGYNTGDVPNHYATWRGDWALWAGLSAPVSDALTFNSQLSYSDAEDLEAVANVSFAVASGFTITPEVVYIHNGVTDENGWGGMLRFDRTF